MADTRFTVLLKGAPGTLGAAGILVTLFLDADGGADLASETREPIIGELALRDIETGRWGVPIPLAEDPADWDHPGVGSPR